MNDNLKKLVEEARLKLARSRHLQEMEEAAAFGFCGCCKKPIDQQQIKSMDAHQKRLFEIYHACPECQQQNDGVLKTAYAALTSAIQEEAEEENNQKDVRNAIQESDEEYIKEEKPRIMKKQIKKSEPLSDDCTNSSGKYGPVQRVDSLNRGLREELESLMQDDDDEEAAITEEINRPRPTGKYAPIKKKPIKKISDDDDDFLDPSFK